MSDILKRYRKVRQQVEKERNGISERLRQIDLLLRNIDREFGRTRRKGMSAPPSSPLCIDQ